MTLAAPRCADENWLPEVLAPRIEFGEHWLWTGTKSRGYGTVKIEQTQWLVHRLVWLLLRGDLPPVLHHKCDQKLCCNPEHLLATTHSEHPDAAPALKRTQTTCIRGHALAWRGRGKWRHRYCPTCHAERLREYRKRSR